MVPILPASVRRRRAKSLRASETDGRRARVRGGKGRGVRGRGGGMASSSRSSSSSPASYSSSSSEVRFRRFVNHETKSSYRDPRKCEVLNCRFGESAKSRENLRGARLPKSFLSRSPRGVPHSGEAHDPRFERRSRSTRVFCADAFRRPGARKDRDARTTTKVARDVGIATDDARRRRARARTNARRR